MMTLQKITKVVGNTMTLNRVKPIHKAKQVAVLGIGALLVVGSLVFVLGSRAQAAACAAPATDYGTATSTVKIDNNATYSIWSQLYAPDATNNSYLLEVDGTSCFVVGDSTNIAPNAWTWVDYQNGAASSKVTLNLSAGSHTVKMIGREPGVQLGRILFLSDTNCVPAGTGSNCTVAADTTPPVVSVIAPTNGSTVSGTVNVTANATDNVAVTKLEFYVNGNVVSTGTTSPYTYVWNTATAANGPNTITAKAYDAAGNATSSEMVQVTVNNVAPSDTQAPSIPSNVSATADAYNKVTVKWNASTDNVGVKGYIVSRNNVPVADVTTGTQYVDTSVLPATQYTYQVSAYDAAKNSSAASANATVSTPSPSTTDTEAPTAPRQVMAQAVSDTQINVTWLPSKDNVGVAGYDVYRATGSGSAQKIATVTTTSLGDTGLKSATKYNYFVKARDAAGNVSAESNTDGEKTKKASAVKIGTLTGTVSYSNAKNNRPRLTLQINGHRHVYTVNSKGKYTIHDLPAGSYEVIYSAKGAQSQTVTVNVEAGKTTRQNIKLR